MTNDDIVTQSISDIETVILKPRFDLTTIKAMAEEVKKSLFSKSLFKPKSQETQLIFFEKYYEPYLVIGGKYSLDYCIEHTFNLDVDKSAGTVYIGGKEFHPQTIDANGEQNIKIAGEEHAHYEKQTFFVIDRMGREISPEKLPFTPFTYKMEENTSDIHFKKLPISTELQINFLKSKIALRPSNVAAIIKETFDITDRTILYSPMYEFIFENLKNGKEASVLINSVTGEMTVRDSQRQLPHLENIAAKGLDTEKTTSKEMRNAHEANVQLATGNPQIRATDESNITNGEANTISTNKNADEDLVTQKNSQPNFVDSEVKRTETRAEDAAGEQTMVLGFPAIIHGEVFSVGDNIYAVVGDIDIISGSNINKTLVVKGNLKIGDNCRANGKLKALKDVIVGADTVIDGDIVAGGNVTIGTRSIVNGSIEAKGSVQLCKYVNVERGLHSNLADTNTASEIEVILDTEGVIASVER